MENMNEKRLLLALSLQRIGFLRPDERLLIWDLVDDELSLSLLLRGDVEAAIGRGLGSRDWAPDSYLEAAERDARYLAKSGCRFIHYDDEAYPAALRETSRPPFGLFARGRALDPRSELVAMVGTRAATGRGLKAAFGLARDLARAGITVVSGLARGIDAAAHRGALAASTSGRTGATCAVLACGIDGVYPPANRGLAGEILDAGGLILSEYAPGEGIHKYRFPERNRIIAGLARACVVVEAPAKSGALITAEHALDEGRDLWVCGACLEGPRSAGIDTLAFEGASVLEGADELLADWGREVPAAQAAARPGVAFADEGGRLASALFDELEIGAEKACLSSSALE